MALFAYRAVDEEGRISSGSLDATNAIDLELRLRRLGLDLITFESVKRSAAARSRRVTRQELITFCFHLSQLLKAGVNILEALTDGIIQLGHAMEKCLTGFDRQFSLGGISQCLQLRQRIAAGVFEQAHHQRRALDLAQEIADLLAPGQVLLRLAAGGFGIVLPPPG